MNPNNTVIISIFHSYFYFPLLPKLILFFSDRVLCLKVLSNCLTNTHQLSKSLIVSFNLQRCIHSLITYHVFFIMRFHLYN